MTDTITSIIPVLAGGVLAISGGVVSQYVLHRLTHSRDQAKERRERIESLVKALYAHERWVIDKKDKMIFRNEDHDDPAPLDEVRMLQALHFPELAAELKAVQDAYIPMLDFIGQQRILHMKDQKSFIENWNPTAFNEAYKQHLQASRALTEKCRTLLRK